MTHFTIDLLAFIEEWLPSAPARVLEVGCGDGSLTRQLISGGFETLGIDPIAPEGECFERTTVEEFRSAAPFDAAVAIGSLHHVADLDRAVASLHSNIRAGGRLVVSEFAVEHLDDAARRWLAEHGARRELDYDYSGVIPLVELERVLGRRFALLAREPVPYLARELGRAELDEAERAAIAEGTLKPVGMRLAYER